MWRCVGVVQGDRMMGSESVWNHLVSMLTL